MFSSGAEDDVGPGAPEQLDGAGFAAVLEGLAELLVHRRARRRGVGRALMVAIEGDARRLGRTTLVLDTLAGHPSETFYRELGWTEVGRIDRYAEVPGGRFEPTVVFARWL